MTYRHRVATVFCSVFLDLINMFIASIAFPAISRALAVSVSQLAWVSNAYSRSDGRCAVQRQLSERWGRNGCSLGLFSLGAGGRACQQPERTDFMPDAAGMGGGLLIPSAALTWPLFQPHERAKRRRR